MLRSDKDEAGIVGGAVRWRVARRHAWSHRRRGTCIANQWGARPTMPRSPLIRYASAPSVVEPCMSSSDSPAHNSSYDLRLIPVGEQHEVTSPASDIPRATARTVSLCFFFLRP